jgi:hypothetical protein
LRVCFIAVIYFLLLRIEALGAFTMAQNLPVNPDLVAHKQSLTLPLSEIVSYLVSNLGKKLTAYIGNATDTRTVEHWLSGISPYRDNELRLRFAYHLVVLLREVESSQVVRAWLTGINPELGDRVALRVLKEGALETVGPAVLSAARLFAAGSCS